MASLSAASLCAATYDYVIAGGGTAGLTLAARLTEDPKIRVAVLEAGQDLTDDLNVQCWGLTAGMLGDPTYDWIYRTTPQVGVPAMPYPLPFRRSHGDQRPSLYP